MPDNPGEVEMHGPAGTPPTVQQMHADHDRLLMLIEEKLEQKLNEVIDGKTEDALTKAAHSPRFQQEMTAAAIAPAAAAGAAGAAAARTNADTLGFGWAKPLVNLTAAGIVFFLFYNLLTSWQGQFAELVRGLAAQGRYDREMYQQSLQTEHTNTQQIAQINHEDSLRKWAAIEKNTATAMAIQAELKQSREVLSELVRAVKGQKPTAEMRLPVDPAPPPNNVGHWWPGWLAGVL